jgi:hypothetical protein
MHYLTGNAFLVFSKVEQNFAEGIALSLLNF